MTLQTVKTIQTEKNKKNEIIIFKKLTTNKNAFREKKIKLFLVKLNSFIIPTYAIAKFDLPSNTLFKDYCLSLSLKFAKSQNS